MSENNHIQKIKNVWERGNYISEPIMPDLYGKKIIDQIAHFFSPGDFYYYILNFDTLKMEYVSDSVTEVLGISPNEFNLEKFLSFYHPKDLEKMEEKERAVVDFKLNFILANEIKDYKTVYLIRYQFPDGSIKKILHQAKAISISKNNKIQQVLGVHTDVSYLGIPIDHKISFISDTLPSYYALDPNNLSFKEVISKQNFTSQELKIILLISEGKSNPEICQELFISENTIKSHRKNIMNKSKARNSVHLIANCIREGII